LLAIVVTLACAPAPARASGDDAHQAYLAGRRAAGESDEGRRYYQQGIALARQALTRDPDDPAGLLWLAANLGGEALTHGKLYALRVIGEIESTLLRLEQHHPMYDRAAAARALGRLYHKAPAIISVGSNAKAADYLGKALERAPAFPGNWAFAADFYADRRDCRRALPLAYRLRAATDLDGYGPDAAEWREIAARVLDDCR
jgi:tetratricopeptide (TPR) repeat protein